MYFQRFSVGLKPAVIERDFWKPGTLQNQRFNVWWNLTVLVVTWWVLFCLGVGVLGHYTYLSWGWLAGYFTWCYAQVGLRFTQMQRSNYVIAICLALITQEWERERGEGKGGICWYSYSEGSASKLGVPLLSLRPVDEFYLYISTYKLCTPFPP